VAAIPPTIPAFATISTFAAALVITTTLAAAISTFTAIATLASAISALAAAVPALASAIPTLASAIANLAFSALIRAGLDYVVLAILAYGKTGAIVVCAVTASPSAFCREVGHAE
jgi:hypothetical protein